MQLEARLHEWRLREKNPDYRPKPAVAITREPGCGAEAVAKRIAAELGMHLYDWELVERIAEAENVTANLVSELEQNPPSDLEEFFRELEGICDLPPQGYFSSLKRVLLVIAIPGNAVIVGRGSNFFLPPNRKIGLCLIAPLEFRISNTMRELGLSEKAARKHISNVEEAHRNLARKYFRADMREPTHYHLVLNTALVKTETIVQMVKLMIDDTQATNQRQET